MCAFFVAEDTSKRNFHSVHVLARNDCGIDLITCLIIFFSTPMSDTAEEQVSYHTVTFTNMRKKGNQKPKHTDMWSHL